MYHSSGGLRKLLASLCTCFRTGSCSPIPLMVTGQPLLIHWEIHPSISVRMKISLVSWIVSTETDPKARRESPSWNLSLVFAPADKVHFEPIKEASLKHLTFKTFSAWPWGRASVEVRYMLGKTEILDTNPTGQRCPCTHHLAFFPRIRWPKRVQTVWPQGL